MKLNAMNQQALERCQVIDAQLKQLAALVKTYKVKAVKNQIPNYGYVGDLGHIKEKLAELLEVHGGVK